MLLRQGTLPQFPEPFALSLDSSEFSPGSSCTSLPLIHFVDIAILKWGAPNQPNSQQ